MNYIVVHKASNLIEFIIASSSTPVDNDKYKFILSSKDDLSTYHRLKDKFHPVAVDYGSLLSTPAKSRASRNVIANGATSWTNLSAAEKELHRCDMLRLVKDRKSLSHIAYAFACSEYDVLKLTGLSIDDFGGDGELVSRDILKQIADRKQKKAEASAKYLERCK